MEYSKKLERDDVWFLCTCTAWAWGHFFTTIFTITPVNLQKCMILRDVMSYLFLIRMSTQWDKCGVVEIFYWGWKLVLRLTLIDFTLRNLINFQTRGYYRLVEDWRLPLMKAKTSSWIVHALGSVCTLPLLKSDESKKKVQIISHHRDCNSEWWVEQELQTHSLPSQYYKTSK